MSRDHSRYVRAVPFSEVRDKGCQVVHLNGHTVALFAQGDRVYAIDNRCPHMGFPLDKGSVSDGILTCHWHHARFDLESGGTFDQFADDVRTFPVDIRQGEIWVDVAQQMDEQQRQQERLQVGLERDIPLVIGKASLVLLADQGDPVAPFQAGLDFGTRYRRGGWQQGLTMLTCFMNILPHLRDTDRPRALYHGLSAVAAESFGQPPRFAIRPLPDAQSTSASIVTLKRWFRQFIEVRDDEGAERCVVSAIRAGASPVQLADMLFAAVTDHRYIDIGHPADFTNKAFEALDIAGWEYAESVLTSLVRGYARAGRMEESNAWRHPIDLIAILDQAFTQLPDVVAQGRGRDQTVSAEMQEELATVLLDDDPQASVDALLAALAAGWSGVRLAAAVSYAAGLRVARFHTSNEFPDWDTALHTFTFANAIEQGLRRAYSVELLRGVFDAATSVYLDRFLNIPAARLPQPKDQSIDPDALLSRLPQLLDRQQQVNEAADLVARYLFGGGSPEPLLALMGRLLLREDRDFHTIQMVEASFRQFERTPGSLARVHMLVAAIRYLAAHSPTVRAQGQTYEIAQRLHRGDRLFEGE